jgi:hypothetical protein
VIPHPIDAKEVTIPEEAKKVAGASLTTAGGFTA